MTDKNLSNHLKFNSNFHTSVNLFLDYQDKKKAKSFIKTAANSKVLEFLSNSLSANSGNHANILVGPYGKGKSHLVLNFLHQHTDFLHIIINGNSQSLQSQFSNALEIALSECKIKIGGSLPEDAVGAYKKVSESLNSTKYRGIIVVFDEFSKYLETTKSVDTKFLQDFAEICNRTPNLNLLLITHKGLASYSNSDKQGSELQKVEGRFNEIGLHNNFDASYHLISAAFTLEDKMEIDDNISNVVANAFSGVDSKQLAKLFEGLYPLHPISAFILPRISELVAQNERTMFTFLSSTQKNSLFDFATNSQFGEFLTPDFLFDYFEEQLRKTEVNSDIHQIYTRIQRIGETLPKDDLQLKTIKSLALIYIIGYFEQLPPTYDVLKAIYCVDFIKKGGKGSENSAKQSLADKVELFDSSISKLRNQQSIIYESHNDGYLSLRELSGVNILDQIESKKNALLKHFRAEDALNHFVSNMPIYPTRHNDENYITRYFAVYFRNNEKSAKRSASAYEILGRGEVENLGVNIKSNADGVVLFKYDESINEELLTISAIEQLLKNAAPGSVYANELKFIENDYMIVVNRYIANILKSDDFSSKCSEKCDEWFKNYFTYNYELVNRHQITTTTSKARGKVLEVMLDPTNKLKGAKTSEEFSSLAEQSEVTASWSMQEKMIFYTFNKALKLENNKSSFKLISKIIRKEGVQNFGEVYGKMQSAENGLGLRKGVLPLLMANVFCEVIKSGKNVVVRNLRQKVEVPLNGDVFSLIDQNPAIFTYEFDESSNLAQNLSEYAAIFENYYIGDFSNPTPHLLAEAVNRWFYSLPNLTISAFSKYSALFDVVSKTISHPTAFFEGEFEQILQTIGKCLPEIKNELELHLTKQYNLVAQEFGVEINEVDALTRAHLGLKLKDLSSDQLANLLESAQGAASKYAVGSSKLAKFSGKTADMLAISDYKLRKFEGRARLLSNEISTALKEMGGAVSQDEKKAVLEDMMRGVENGIL